MSGVPQSFTSASAYASPHRIDRRLVPLLAGVTVIWLSLRLLLVLAGVSAGSRVADWGARATGTATLAGVFLLFVALATLPVMVVGAIARGRYQRNTLWARPGWRERPFFGEPLQFLHAMGWYFIAAGLSAVIHFLAGEVPSPEGAMMVGGLGVGLLAGCHAIVLILPRSFKPKPQRGPSRKAPSTGRG